MVCVDEKSQIQALDPHRAHAADASGTNRTPDLRLHPPRHHHAVRRARDRHWARSSTPASLATGTPSFWPSSSRPPRPTSGCRYTWSATTTPPTNTPRSTLSWPAIPASQLHFIPDQLLLAQPCRMPFLHSHPPGHPPRHLHFPGRPHRRHQGLHRRQERPSAFHLDQDRRRATRQDPSNHDDQAHRRSTGSTSRDPRDTP